jgi:hypothetical protein
MNTIVVIEDQATNERHEYKSDRFASALDVRCPCGGRIHPILGAWCLLCGAKVIEVRHVS